jgi:hypothetical protein
MWGMAMFHELEGYQCNGVAMAGPSGEEAQVVNSQEQCAQSCYLAASWWKKWENSGKVVPTAEGFYCEGYSFDENTRHCTLYGEVDPKVTAHDVCYVARELPNPCRFDLGTWVRGADSSVYYVGDNAGNIYMATSDISCGSEDVWKGKDTPDLYCDGISDPSCDMCIDTLKSHNKYIGDFTCKVYKRQMTRVCQFEEAFVSCSDDLLISVEKATYGRLSDRFCGNPTSSGKTEALTMVATGECGEPNNVLDVVRGICNGKAQCSLKADDDEFRDQGCESIFKYLEVTYECKEAAASK